MRRRNNLSYDVTRARERTEHGYGYNIWQVLRCVYAYTTAERMDQRTNAQDASPSAKQLRFCLNYCFHCACLLRNDARLRRMLGYIVQI